jgi:hypothetical protein
MHIVVIGQDAEPRTSRSGGARFFCQEWLDSRADSVDYRKAIEILDSVVFDDGPFWANLGSGQSVLHVRASRRAWNRDFKVSYNVFPAKYLQKT